MLGVVDTGEFLMSTHRSTASSALARYDAINHDLAVRFSAVLEQQLAAARDELLAATGCTSVSAARDVVTRQRAAAPPPKKSPRQSSRGAGKPARTATAPRKQQHPLPYLRGQDEGRRTSTTKTRRALPTRMTGVVSGGLPSTSRRH